MFIKIICALIPLYFYSGIFVSAQSVIPTWDIYNEANSSLPNNTIRCLLIDHLDDLWIGTDNGVAHLSNDIWEVFNVSNSGLAGNYVRALAVDDSNHIWIGTTVGGLQRFDGTTWLSFNTSNSGIPDNYIKTISIDNFGKKWIGSVEGLTYFDDTSWTTWNTENSSILTNNIASIGIGQQNEKYIGTINGGLVYMDSNENIIGLYYVLNSGVPDNSALVVQMDSIGRPWYACSAGGLFTDPGNQNWIVFNYSNSPMNTNSLTTMCLDGDNNFYLGTQLLGLMIRRFDQSWQFYDESNSDLPENHILSIEKDNKGNVWIGTNAEGLVKLKENFVGIDEEGSLAQLQFFPNPVQNNGLVHFNRVLQRPIIDIFGSDAKSVFHASYHESLSSFILPNLNPGYYTIKIEEEKQVLTLKVLITN